MQIKNNRLSPVSTFIQNAPLSETVWWVISLIDESWMTHMKLLKKPLRYHQYSSCPIITERVFNEIENSYPLPPPPPTPPLTNRCIFSHFRFIFTSGFSETSLNQIGIMDEINSRKSKPKMGLSASIKNVLQWKSKNFSSISYRL